MGVSQKTMVLMVYNGFFFMENPIFRWMINGGYSHFGTPPDKDQIKRRPSNFDPHVRSSAGQFPEPDESSTG